MRSTSGPHYSVRSRVRVWVRVYPNAIVAHNALVIGYVDCTHIPHAHFEDIKVSLPGGNNEGFSAKERFFLLMCKQSATLICLSQTLNAVGQVPRTIAACLIIVCSQFENNLIDGLLLGDGGHPCRHYLMTPVTNLDTDKERNYNKAHIAKRGKVERMFGVWKQRFCCLRIPLRTHFRTSLTVIV